jgi:heat shock protein HslJ
MKELVGIVVLGLALVVGCTSDDEGRVPTQEELENHVFVSTEIEGIDVPEEPDVELSFSDEGVGVRSGCGGMGSGYTIDGDQLRFTGGQLYESAMSIGCDPTGDRTLDALLMEGMDVRIDGDELVLERGDSLVRLERWADQDPFDPHTRWWMTGYGRPEPEREVLAGAFSPTITFREDGTVLLESRCGDHAWPVEVHEDAAELTFGEPHGTDELCPANAITMERFVQRVFTGTATYEVEGQQLVIANGERRLFLGA